MTKRQRLFYGDMPEDLYFHGTVAMNHPFPSDAKPGAVLMCAMRGYTKVKGKQAPINGVYFFIKGRSHVWHEFEPHTSHLLRLWVDMENAKVARKRAKEVDYRPWED
jgi:hypothetical protein